MHMIIQPIVNKMRAGANVKNSELNLGRAVLIHRTCEEREQTSMFKQLSQDFEKQEIKKWRLEILTPVHAIVLSLALCSLAATESWACGIRQTETTKL